MSLVQKVLSLFHLYGHSFNNDSKKIVYTGDGWLYNNARSMGDVNDDVNATKANGDYVEYKFTGNGIEYITEKNADQGKVDVFIDGELQGTVDCLNDTRIAQQAVFSKHGLSNGEHTIKLVKKDAQWLVLDAFIVYN